MVQYIRKPFEHREKQMQQHGTVLSTVEAQNALLMSANHFSKKAIQDMYYCKIECNIRVSAWAMRVAKVIGFGLTRVKRLHVPKSSQG